jgi:hypothetical protein
VIAGEEVHRWSNDTWTRETVAADTPTWTAGAEHDGDLYLVGVAGTPAAARIARYTGGTWTDLPAPVMAQPCGIAVVAEDDVWVSGYNTDPSPDDGVVAHWNGTTWTTTTLAGAGELCSIAEHGGEVWVGGYTDENGHGDPTALYHRATDGTWTSSEPLPTGSVRALVVHAGELWAAGDHGAILHRP